MLLARFFGEFHFERMAFAVDRRRNKTDLIAEVELRENRIESGAVLGWRGDEVLTTGVLGHVMEDLRVFADERQDSGITRILDAEDDAGCFEEVIDQVV